MTDRSGLRVMLVGICVRASGAKLPTAGERQKQLEMHHKKRTAGLIASVKSEIVTAAGSDKLKQYVKMK